LAIRDKGFDDEIWLVNVLLGFGWNLSLGVPHIPPIVWANPMFIL
jgi:hypothetical protein